MPKIRIYTKGGHQIELDVLEFSIIPGKEWKATTKTGKPKLLTLDPEDIEAVLQLTYDDLKDPKLLV